MKKLFGAWLCAVVVACAAAPKQSVQPAVPSPRPQTMPEDSHSEIQQLSDQIDQQRQQMNLPAPAPIEPMAAHAATEAPIPPPHAEDTTCHPGPSETCSTSCTLSDSICGNADKICKLADGMPGDDWAANKCASAKQSCTDANKRCCTCS